MNKLVAFYAAAVCAGVMFCAAPASALSLKACNDEWNGMKTAGTVGGTRCGAGRTGSHRGRQAGGPCRARGSRRSRVPVHRVVEVFQRVGRQGAATYLSRSVPRQQGQ
jgi:hypothetical protein